MTIPWLHLSTRVAHFLGVSLPEETDFEGGVEAWGRDDYDTALREFRPLAEQGHAQAQVNLGIIYVKGEGVQMIRMGIGKINGLFGRDPTPPNFNAPHPIPSKSSSQFLNWLEWAGGWWR